MRKNKILAIILLVTFLFFMNTGFTYAITPVSNDTYEGIDVSDWQGYIDYGKVKQAGIEIVYIKASQGSNLKDAYFDINYENAKNNGLKVGFYHFLTATNTQEAEKEAQFFASVISKKTPDCKLALDYEIFGGVSSTEINNIATVFLETTKRLTNKEVILYSDLYNARTVFSRELADTYPLWLADYTDAKNLQEQQANWEKWAGWQYTDRGVVDGISGYVDRDKYAKEIFLEETSEISENENSNGNPNENPSFNTKTVTYTIQSGDTLWQIALKYGTTVQEIANINGISNPNLIYPGQVLRILENSTVEGKEERGTGSIVYTVKRGDTISKIAMVYGVTAQHIVEMNDIQNPNLIYPGEKLRITESRSNQLNEMGNPNLDVTYVVRKGDTLWGISRKFGVSVDYLVRKNGIRDRNLIYVGEIIRV